MKFTLSWLKEHLDTQAGVDEVAETLTRIGLEVEGVDNPGEKLAAFKVARVLTAERHPNLQDDEWLWGGSLADIEQTIRFGARGTHADTRAGEMIAFGRDGILNRAEIESVSNYVLSLSGRAFNPKLKIEDGGKIFAQNCASCHGDAAKGNRDLGARYLRVRPVAPGTER